MLSWKAFILSLLLGFAASGVLVALTMMNSPYGLSSLEYTRVKVRELKTVGSKELMRGSFTSPDNYLGILFVPFRAGKPLPEVPVEFKLFEKSSQRLVHSYTYVAKNFSDELLFPFGIPTIRKSDGAEYIFVLEAHEDETGLDGLILDTDRSISTVHLYDRRDLTRANIGGFLALKVIQSLALLTPGPFIVILIGSLLFPALVWLLAKIGIVTGKVAQKHFFWFLTDILAITVLIMIPRVLSDAIYTLWVLFHLATSIIIKRPAREHYMWALVMLAFCPIFLTFSDGLRAEKSAIFVFFFLCFGVGHEIITMIRHPERYNEANDSA